MLSLPRQYNNVDTNPEAPPPGGVWGYLSPKRTQALIARESAVAVREAEVARREAELLIGAPGGVVPAVAPCPPCAATTVFETVSPPIQTIIKEIVKEDSLTPPGWASGRAEEVLDRELRIAERERDISKREESVNRREHDASRRESWIMEQLIALGNDDTVEEEYVYEPKRKAKFQQLPPIETLFEPETKTVVQTETITVPAPANTRRAASPAPQVADPSSIPDSPRTTAVEIVTEHDIDDDGLKTVTVVRPPRTARRPRGWFGGW